MTYPATDDKLWRQLVAQTTGCKNPEKLDTVQSLWSGFGSIFRVQTNTESLIVKHVSPPCTTSHPRGWSGDFATERKLRSYRVETHWYQHYSHLCDELCRVPLFYNAQTDEHQRVLLLEDLDAAGFPLRYESLSPEKAMYCVDWLAHFHARFMGVESTGLWPVGTYWHLETRPDEFDATTAGRLKDQATKIDRILSACQYQTLVHGDAKVANFCFGNSDRVAAVDFQYTGGGCGMKDLAYFIGSCFTEDDCEACADALVDRYFATLACAIDDSSISSVIEHEWRQMYPLAWTDFYRFLAGWMPQHRKINRYIRAMAEQTFDMLPDYP
jgi:hypothetical protein